MFLCIAFVVILFIVITYLFPIIIFFTIARTATDLFILVKNSEKIVSSMNHDPSAVEICIKYNMRNYHYNGIQEAYSEVENKCNKALKYYNILIDRDIASVEAQHKKDKLISICNQIRLERWQSL